MSQEDQTTKAALPQPQRQRQPDVETVSIAVGEGTIDGDNVIKTHATVKTLAEQDDMRYLKWYRKPVVRHPGDDFMMFGPRPLVPSYLVLDLTVSRSLTNLGLATEAILNNEVDNVPVHRVLSMFLMIYLPIFLQWLKTQHFANRFDSEDIVFTFHSFSSMLLMAYASLNVHSCAARLSKGLDDRGGCAQFTGSLVGLRFIHVCFLIYVYYHNRQYSRYLRRQMAADVVVLLLYIMVTAGGPSVAEYTWVIGIVVDLGIWLLPHFIPFFKLRQHERVPLHPNLLVSRHRRFATIALAYIIGGALASTAYSRTSMTSCELIIVTCACFIVVGLKIQYFDFTDVTRPSDSDAYGSRHPTVRIKPHGRYRIAWELLHIPLNIAVVLVGSSFRYFISGDSEENACLSRGVTSDKALIHRKIVGLGLSLASLVTVLQQLLSSGGMSGFRKRRLSKPLRLSVRFVSIIGLAGSPFLLLRVSRAWYMVTATLWFVLFVFFDVFARMPNRNRRLPPSQEEVDTFVHEKQVARQIALDNLHYSQPCITLPGDLEPPHSPPNMTEPSLGYVPHESVSTTPQDPLREPLVSSA
eukprot:m.12172 g.12172  ORF g.12172 m.12172 type:complete len:582 (-) comp5808_c0_seq1:147-1892(-)